MTVELTRGEVWDVRLDRPQQANALSAELVEALHAVLDEAETVRLDALVLRGNDRHFAAGFDLTALEDETDGSLAHRFLRIGLLLERVQTAPYLTIAVVEGAAVGAGADLAAACDHRIGTRGAAFQFPGTGFGVLLGTRRLTDITGAHHALDGAHCVAAPDAAARGLLTAITDEPETVLDSTIRRWQRTAPAVRPNLLAQTRGRDHDRSLAALARSVAVPGLRDRILAYARPRTKEHA